MSENTGHVPVCRDLRGNMRFPAFQAGRDEFLHQMRMRSAVAAALGSLTNTVLYLGLMLLFYIFCGIDTTSVLALIGGTALIAGSCEALAAAILVPPVLAAVSRIGRSPRLHHAK